MHVLITYDVATRDKEGKKRLRAVAKACQDWGRRVQASVLECKVDPAQYIQLKQRLTALIDADTDSLRFYNLGKHWHARIEHVGVDRSQDPDAPLIV